MRTWWIGALVIGLSLWGGSARAQAPAATQAQKAPGADAPRTAETPKSEAPAAAQAPKAEESPKSEAPIDDATARGRAAYLRGVERSRDAQWGEALAAFEEAAAARDAPLVQYNIGVCERALGLYVAARRTFRRLIEDPRGLATPQIEDSKAFVDELGKLIVRLTVTLDPKGAQLLVDGRPLQAVQDGGVTVYVLVAGAPAGTGPAESVFRVDLDPGIHLFRAARAGHQDAFVSRTYKPGERASLDLHLDTLPARVHVQSDPVRAIVRVDGRESGLAPIEIERPPGVHRIEVVMDGYDTYVATLDLHAGQRADITAKLVRAPEPMLKQWWFWAGAAAVAGAGVAITYVATKPTRPYDGGSLDWVVKPAVLRW